MVADFAMRGDGRGRGKGGKHAARHNRILIVTLAAVHEFTSARATS